jgi:hypothetical protein
MKILGLAFLFLITACDPYGFGFKKNPAYILDEAFKAIQNLDVESFLEVTRKEALCIYGNPKGLNYLKNKLDITPDEVKINPVLVDSRHHKIPNFGYWSYYEEKYVIEVHHHKSKDSILEAVITCDYGTDGEKDDKLINLKPKKYKHKECRAVKLIPRKFAPLPLPSKCGKLAVAHKS